MSFGAVRKMERIDDKIFHCGRKTGFPLKAMADRAAEAATKDDGSLIVSYLCQHCNKYHIGHARQEKPQEPKMAHKFFYDFEGITLAKIKDEFNQYIFAVPPGTPENDVSVLERGVLVAYKKGSDIYREKGGRKSEFHQIFYHIFPFYAKELVRFREKTETHEDFMEEIPQVRMDFLNGVHVPSLTERVKKSNQVKDHAAEQREFAAKKLAEEEKRLVQEQEMYNNRAVFRNEEGFKPHHRDIFKCCNEGCGEEIELRAYIRSNSKGYLTTITPRMPVDPRVARKGTSNTQWICGSCMDRVNNPGKYAVEAAEAAEVGAAEAEPSTAVDIAAASGAPEPEPELSLGIMSDLKRITMDPAYSAAFVRGAMMMAFSALEIDRSI